MLTLTTEAGAHLAEMLTQAGAPDEAAVRLLVSDEGVALAADSPKPDDTTFEHDGRTVLVMEQSVADALSERTIDVRDTPEGKSLAIS